MKEKERNAETKALAKKMKGELSLSRIGRYKSVLTFYAAEDREAERAKKRDAKIAAEHDKSAAKEQKQRAKDAAKEEKQHDRETSKLQQEAAFETSRLEKQKEKEIKRDPSEAEPTSPQKKSPWKKLIPHRHEREPGRISKFDKKSDSKTVPAPEDGYTAATGKSSELPPKKESVDLTPTGATMAGDGPSTIAAPDATPAPESEQATTPLEELSSPVVAESSSSRKIDETEDTPSPASPSKKRFSRLMGKLKRGKKEDSKTDNSDANSFTGGAKLHKERRDESRTASGTTDTSSAVPATTSAAAAAAPERSRSSSISSLSESDEEDAQPRGRSATRLDHVASHVAATKHSESSDEGEGDWEEARDRFDGELAPPNNGILSKKHTESPVRDSKFVEDF
jgi:hypothetical protein